MNNMNRLNTTSFITQDELAQKLFSINMNKKHYLIGGVPLLVQDSKIYVDSSDSHTMIFGATGSKKTRMFVMPSIEIFAKAGESFVVTDPKGEVFERTAGNVQELGYDVKCMNLRDFRDGFTWNPLRLPYEFYRKGKQAKAVEFVNEMARMIIGENATNEVFWVNSAVDVLCGFTLLMFELATRMECNLRSLIDLWNNYMENRKKTLRTIKEKFGDTIIYQKISGLCNESDKTIGSIEAFISMGLNKLAINEDFVEFLSQEGESLTKLTENKMAIYLVVPDENRSYHFVVSLFLEQLYEVLINKAQNEPDKRLPRRVNFMIDEFGNIPKIDSMEAMITAARSRNIRFDLIVQGMNQLKQKYGQGAEIISGNCNNWIYLYSKEYELLQEISRLCGEVIYDNNIRMPLFSEFDLQHLDKDEGEALILAGRNYPCISRLLDIDEYPFVRQEYQKKGPQKEWLSMKEYSVMKKKDYRYSFPLEYSAIKELCEKPIPEKEKWLVGAGPEGMILVEGTFTEKQIESGYAYYKVLEDMNPKGFLQVEDLEWYTAELTVRETYKRIAKETPSIVCPVIPLLGKSRFTLKKKCEFTVKGKYRMEVQMNDVEQDLEDNVILNEEINDYGGMLGAWYAHNVLFRRLNGVLEGTKFEKVPWERFSESAFEGIVYYIKALDNENNVITYLYPERNFSEQ